MKTDEIGHKEAKAKSEKLIAGAKVVFLGTNGSLGGHPNVRAMVPVKVEGVSTIWFMTDLDSSKIIELIKNDKAIVYAYAPRSMAECRLWGTVEILEDAPSRKAVWRDEFKSYFDGGVNDPRLRVLRFDVSNGMYCNKDGKSGTFTR